MRRNFKCFKYSIKPEACVASCVIFKDHREKSRSDFNSALALVLKGWKRFTLSSGKYVLILFVCYAHVWLNWACSCLCWCLMFPLIFLIFSVGVFLCRNVLSWAFDSTYGNIDLMRILACYEVYFLPFEVHFLMV